MSLAEAMIGWIAPPVCINCGEEGFTLCLECTSEIQPYGRRCFRCGVLSPDFKTCQSCRRPGGPNKVFIPSIYKGLARGLIRAYKYDQQRSTAVPIARIMANFYMQIPQASTNYLIVPVPTATKRVRERGFDHSKLLARNLAELLNSVYSVPIKRVGQSRQVGSARAERLKQLEGAFRINDIKHVYGQRILLVDDVVTTGATITEASKTLHCAGAKSVDALIFAKRL